MARKLGKKKSSRSTGRISMRDISEVCGFSVMTVSRALRNLDNVKPSTREKVLETAQSMAYVPNKLASSFGQQKTSTVGIVIPDISHSIFPAVVKSIERHLSREDYQPFLCCTYDDVQREYKDVVALLERRVDGIIIAPASQTDSREAVAMMQAMKCPFVFLDRVVRDLEADAVIVNDYEGAYEATRHLIEQGYRRIAHLAGYDKVWTCGERLRGYLEALEDAGIPVRDDYILKCELTVGDGERQMARLLRAEETPDAVFCVNDPVGVGAYLAITAEGLIAPDDVGIVGFSNTLESRIMGVPMTTVGQDTDELGRQAADILLSRMMGTARSEEPIRRVIDTEFIVRKSSVR